MAETKSYLILNERDCVAVALAPLAAGTVLPEPGLTCLDAIPAGHKVALRDIRRDEMVYKYGQVIGFASMDIPKGRHVHDHNLEVRPFDRESSAPAGSWSSPVSVPEAATFDGIVRPDGRVATRNYIAVLATCNCSASLVRFIAQAFTPEVLKEFPQVDGVVPLYPANGCGMPGYGTGFEYLQRVISGYMRHVNFGGVLLVGLGCEVNNVSCLMTNGAFEAGPLLGTLNIQDNGGTPGTLEAGVAAVREMLPVVNAVRREPVPLSHLTLALECGGSDAYSGISANPALGLAVDMLVSRGGTAILAETPEIYGAEHLLISRAVSPDVGKKLKDRVLWWEKYTELHGAELNNNPVPGNKAGGLTTILEKSLGAAAKGGSSPLMDVYEYAQPVEAHGFVFMDTPGYDAVSLTGMVAGGANIACFTTGRGTVCAVKPAPTIKLASNSAMYQRLPDDMDVNAGEIIDGTTSLEELGRRIFDLILETASGRPSKSESYGIGDAEFVPWPMGAVM